MSRASVLARGRLMAAASFIDACTIVRVTADATSETSGAVTPTSTSTIYTGPCRVQEPGGYARDITTAPDQPQLAPHRILQLPVTSVTGDVDVGDRVTITASVNDPGLVGVVMIVRDLAAKSEATARRLGVEQVTG